MGGGAVEPQRSDHADRDARKADLVLDVAGECVGSDLGALAGELPGLDAGGRKQVATGREGLGRVIGRPRDPGREGGVMG